MTASASSVGPESGRKGASLLFRKYSVSGKQMGISSHKKLQEALVHPSNQTPVQFVILDNRSVRPLSALVLSSRGQYLHVTIKKYMCVFQYQI
jgi:hypothetical protein